MNKFESASILAGMSPNEEPQVSEPTNLHVITGEVVSRSEDGTVMVSMDGLVFSEDDTQYIEMDTIGGLEEGDDATIILAGENGSAMSPLAVGSAGSVDRVRETAESASQIAEAAQEVAEATNQHFFADTNGIHVTETTQEDWDESHTGANVLINSIGQLFRDGLNNLLTLTTENGARALTIWDGMGNAAENIRAIIGETIQLGKADGYHVSIDADSLDVMDATTTLASFGSEVLIGPTNDNHIEIGTMTNGSKGLALCNQDAYELEITRREFFSPWTGEPFFFDMQGGNQSIDFMNSGVEIWALGDPVESNYAKAVLKLNARIGTANQVGSFTFQTNAGSNTWSTPAGTILWSGTGWHMTAGHTANLAYNVSTCPTGIVLHFQPYTSSTVQNYNHIYHFVPKTHVASYNGAGIVVHLGNPDFSNIASKYLYISNDHITGNNANNTTGTNSGITYNNAAWVMTQVIAV